MEKFTLAVHEHPLYRVGCNDLRLYYKRRDCDGCSGEGHIGDGFRCSKCPGLYLHRKCGESALEINHPSHPQHPLKLLIDQQRCNGKRCHFCGIYNDNFCYHCSICDFTVDIGCAINPPPLPIIEESKAHDHPLTMMMSTDAEFTCHICCSSRQDRPYFYSCSRCELFFHIDCASLSPEINHACHPRHLLKFFESGSSSNNNHSCILCGREHGNGYHCSICNFTVDVRCVRNPPPLTLVSRKTHMHQLTLTPRLISFTCNACGMQGDRSPYVCVQCNFFIHVDCVDLPRVIYINRHDHPVSHNYHLDRIGNSSLECGVCHKNMDLSYGAYSCFKCKTYAVHSRCAASGFVWDGLDVEGEPEEIEDVAPFKVIGNNLIKHFTHEEHDMKLVKEGSAHEGTKCCRACIKPISEGFYKCIQCDYVLDEACANLPRKIRTMLSATKPILVGGASYFNRPFRCCRCYQFSSGFRYMTGYNIIDLQCILSTDRQERQDHPHPLYFTNETSLSKCSSCGQGTTVGFECVKDGCEFYLCFRKCALFPERVKHKSDDHTLRLCGYGRDHRNDPKYWCDICEKRIDHSKQYYTCDECGTTLHTKCVLGDLFRSISPGSIITGGTDIWGPHLESICKRNFIVVTNTGVNRRLCCVCDSRCTFPLALKVEDSLNRYVCSDDCFYVFIYGMRDD